MNTHPEHIENELNMMTDEELQRVLEQYKKKRNCSSEAMLKHFAEVLSCELFDYMAFARGKNEGINEGKSDLSNEIMHWINSKNRGSADYFIVDKIEEICKKYVN